MHEVAGLFGANREARRLDRVAVGYRLAQVKSGGRLPEYAVRLIAEVLERPPSDLAELPVESVALRKVALMRCLIDRARLRPENREAALRRHLARLAGDHENNVPAGDIESNGGGSS